MKTIDAEFIHDVQENHHANGDANGQSEDIDEGKNLILHQITPGRNEIVPDHESLFEIFVCQLACRNKTARGTNLI